MYAKHPFTRKHDRNIYKQYSHEDLRCSCSYLLRSFYSLSFLICISIFIFDGMFRLLQQHSDPDTLNSSTAANAIEC